MSQHLKHFSETDIDSFREAFFLFAKNRTDPIFIKSLDEIILIMRSLGLSPTIREIKSYMREYNNKLSFSDFLAIVHQHSRGKIKITLILRCMQYISIIYDL